MVMRYWYDFSYDEIAEATHTTVSAVKSRLHRARGSMGQMLEPNAAAPRPAAHGPLRVGG
jgi:RNA polymerase sigma-70 factor (ECF subfamily)